jgi:hypothetical protein
MAQAVLWQRVEGALVFVASIGLFLHFNEATSWWVALLVFFAPDLGFLGYLAGPRAGAAIYNLLHIYALGVALIALGLIIQAPIMIIEGTLWLAHCGFDRMLGYGLKLPEGFSFTHLGKIGKTH